MVNKTEATTPRPFEVAIAAGVMACEPQLAELGVAPEELFAQACAEWESAAAQLH